ncbi:MAG: hypothetical protein Q7J78_03590 [Clostridiales bacterium]|nr:hypothetical protein [Clostridiales bacterium]
MTDYKILVLIMGRELADINQVTAVMVVIALFGLLVDKALFNRLELEVRYRWGLGKNL